MKVAEEIPVNPFKVNPTADSHFAWIRTRMSIEGTLLAWVRTAASLISFGFTIVTFLQRLPESGKRLVSAAPRDLGLALILAGVIALAISTLQYNSMDKYLRNNGFEVLAGTLPSRYKTATPVIAGLLFVIGLFAFFAVLFRMT